MLENKKYKILVVDDEEDILTLVKFRLKSQGYKVLEAMDGAGALKEIEQSSPHLLLLDYKLPDFNGAELVRRIKEEMKLSLPIIIFTASSAFINTIKALPIDDYVLKPFDPQELLGKIQGLLEKYYRNESIVS